MTDKNFEFEKFINEILDLSGEIALNNFRKIRDLTLKGDFSPVTKADGEIEQFIRGKIFEKYPSHKIIGEELDDFEGSENVTWYIDPIDGTRSFVAGKHDFGTLIALVIDNELIGGVIDCPALGERWTSFRSNETKVNQKITKCKAVDNLKDAVMATTSSHEFGMKKWRAYQSLEQSVKVTTTGSDCYNYGLLASGYIDIVAERLTAPIETNSIYSCRNEQNIVLNFFRWENGAVDFKNDMETYRIYLINHETGHILGWGHVGCPKEGAIAPVMMQQSKGTEGCIPYGWPAYETIKSKFDQ